MTRHPDDQAAVDDAWSRAGDAMLAADLATEDGRKAALRAYRAARREARQVRLRRLGVSTRHDRD